MLGKNSVSVILFSSTAYFMISSRIIKSWRTQRLYPTDKNLVGKESENDIARLRLKVAAQWHKKQWPRADWSQIQKSDG